MLKKYLFGASALMALLQSPASAMWEGSGTEEDQTSHPQTSQHAIQPTNWSQVVPNVIKGAQNDARWNKLILGSIKGIVKDKLDTPHFEPLFDALHALEGQDRETADLFLAQHSNDPYIRIGMASNLPLEIYGDLRAQVGRTYLDDETSPVRLRIGAADLLSKTLPSGEGYQYLEDVAAGEQHTLKNRYFAAQQLRPDSVIRTSVLRMILEKPEMEGNSPDRQLEAASLLPSSIPGRNEFLLYSLRVEGQTPNNVFIALDALLQNNDTPMGQILEAAVDKITGDVVREIAEIGDQYIPRRREFLEAMKDSHPNVFIKKLAAEALTWS